MVKFLLIISIIFIGCIHKSEWSKENIEIDLKNKSITLFLNNIIPKQKSDIDSAWTELNQFFKNEKLIDSSTFPILQSFKTELIIDKKKLNGKITIKYFCAKNSSCSDEFELDESINLLDLQCNVQNHEIVCLNLEKYKLSIKKDFVFNNNLTKVSTGKNSIYYISADSTKLKLQYEYELKNKNLNYISYFK